MDRRQKKRYTQKHIYFENNSTINYYFLKFNRQHLYIVLFGNLNISAIDESKGKGMGQEGNVERMEIQSVISANENICLLILVSRVFGFCVKWFFFYSLSMGKGKGDDDNKRHEEQQNFFIVIIIVIWFMPHTHENP